MLVMPLGNIRLIRFIAVRQNFIDARLAGGRSRFGMNQTRLKDHMGSIRQIHRFRGAKYPFFKDSVDGVHVVIISSTINRGYKIATVQHPYLAYSMVRLSRSTVTRTSPG